MPETIRIDERTLREDGVAAFLWHAFCMTPTGFDAMAERLGLGPSCGFPFDVAVELKVNGVELPFVAVLREVERRSDADHEREAIELLKRKLAGNRAKVEAALANLEGELENALEAWGQLRD